MGKLPKLSNTSPLRQSYQVQFGGLNHNKGAQDGELYDMMNMSSDHYPVLSQRNKRKYLATLHNATGGIFSYGGVIVFVDGSEVNVLRGDSIKKVGTVSEGEKNFASFRNQVMIFPDKVYVNLDDDSFGSLGIDVKVSEAYFKAEGSLYGEAAENNTIYAPSVDFSEYFKIGDAVQITGCKVNENNKTPIIREVDGNYLRFYENVFKTAVSYYTYEVKAVLPANATSVATNKPVYGFTMDGNRLAFSLPYDASVGTRFEWVTGATMVQVFWGDDAGKPAASFESLPVEGESVTITKHLGFVGQYGDVRETNITLSRTVPDMDFVISDDNRLWGAKGNTIYGSKLGDPTNFNVFDGLSTDSYSVEVGNAGDITAAMTYGGYPTFFKEDGIYRLYGDKPSNYQIMPTMKQGVKAGCAKSLAVAGEVLYYISRNGIMAYTGGVPTKADEALGFLVEDGVAASDGQKYYISAYDGEKYGLYVYDTAKGMWHKEDDLELTYATYDKAVLGLAADGKLIALSRGVDGTEESAIDWLVEFADMTYGSPFQKGIVKANVRFDLAQDAEAIAEISYDGDDWEMIREFRGTGKRSNVLPIIPHRCDHFRLRMRGTGVCDIYSLAVQYYYGSEKY